MLTVKSQFWHIHPELKKFFGTKFSFYSWMGRHEDELHPLYTVEEIISLRIKNLAKRGITID